jgi:peptide/nickel transport system substrate-binding protein
VADVLNDLSAVPDSYVPPNHPLLGRVGTYVYDPEAARERLASIGWIDHDVDPHTPLVASGVPGVPDGTPFQFDYMAPTDAERPQVGAIIQESLAQCGFGVNLVSQDWDSLMAPGPEGPLFGRQFDMAQFAWSATLEPACELFNSAEIPGPFPDYAKGWGGANLSGYNNPAFDQACLQARLALPGSDGRQVAHQEAQAIFAEDLPVVPLYQRIRLVAMRVDVCNLDMDPAGFDLLHSIEWLDYGEGCP